MAGAPPLARGAANGGIVFMPLPMSKIPSSKQAAATTGALLSADRPIRVPQKSRR